MSTDLVTDTDLRIAHLQRHLDALTARLEAQQQAIDATLLALSERISALEAGKR
jgi:hypothetical protein